MSHELEVDAQGKAKMFSGEGLTPWHGLGEVVEGLATAKEALELAGLDWEVKKMPVSFRDEDGYDHVVPDRFATVRATDNRYLGNVGEGYTPYQNEEAFSFFDTVVDSGDAKYTSAGSLFGGKRVWMTAKVGDTMTVCGEDTDLYLLLTNSHDGSRALTAATTMVRAVCNNTVTMGLNRAKTRWTLRHRNSLEGKADEARRALELAFKNASAFEDEVKKLLDIQVTKDEFAKIVTDLLPEQKLQKQKNVDSLVSIFESETTVVDTIAKDNAWGAYNAATFWTDHARKSRSAEGRMLSLLDGFAAKFRNDLHERLLTLA